MLDMSKKYATCPLVLHHTSQRPGERACVRACVLASSRRRRARGLHRAAALAKPHAVPLPLAVR